MVIFEELDKITEQLQKTLEIFTKNPYRTFKADYILNKQTLKKNFRTKFNEELKKFVDPLDKEIVTEKITKNSITKCSTKIR